MRPSLFFSAFLVALFVVVMPHISAAAPGDPVCPEVPDGITPEEDKSVTRTIKATEMKSIIGSLKEETHEEVKIDPKTSQVTIISKCGKEGEPGTVKYCFAAGKAGCFTFQKSDGLDKVADRLTAVLDKGQAVLAASDPAKARAATQQLIRELTGGKAPKSLHPLLRKLADSQGCYSILSPHSPSQCIKLAAEGLGNAFAKNENIAQDVLQKIASGDTAGAARKLNTLAQGAGLNVKISPSELRNFQKDVVRLIPQATGALKTLQAELTSLCTTYGSSDCAKAVASFSVDDLLKDVGNTFGVPTGLTGAVTTGGLIPTSATLQEKLGGFVSSLTGHGCQNNTLACRTNNPGAMTFVSWMKKYGGYACGQANNTACFGSIERGLAAKADLILRRIRSGCNTLYKILEQCRYSSVKDGNDSATYARVAGGKAGLGPHTLLDPNNTQQIAKLLSAMSWYEGGRGIGFNATQLQNALLVAYGVKSAADLPQGTPGFIPGTSPTTMLGSLFSAGGGNSLFSKVAGGLFGLSSNPMGFLSRLFGGGKKPSNGSSTASNASSAQTPTQATDTTATSTTSTSVQKPIISVAATKIEMAHDEVASIVWSSLRTRGCVLYRSSVQNSSEVAVDDGKTGSYRFEVPSNTFKDRAVVFTFTLRCIPEDGRATDEDRQRSLEIKVEPSLIS